MQGVVPIRTTLRHGTRKDDGGGVKHIAHAAQHFTKCPAGEFFGSLRTHVSVICAKINFSTVHGRAVVAAVNASKPQIFADDTGACSNGFKVSRGSTGTSHPCGRQSGHVSYMARLVMSPEHDDAVIYKCTADTRSHGNHQYRRELFASAVACLTKCVRVYVVQNRTGKTA